MKILDYALLSTAVAFFIIGVDQIIRLQVAWVDAYWIFMVVVLCLISLNLRKVQRSKQDAEQKQEKASPKKKAKPHKKRSSKK